MMPMRMRATSSVAAVCAPPVEVRAESRCPADGGERLVVSRAADPIGFAATYSDRRLELSGGARDVCSGAFVMGAISKKMLLSGADHLLRQEDGFAAGEGSPRGRPCRDRHHQQGDPR
jgi:hypothetical protein